MFDPEAFYQEAAGRLNARIDAAMEQLSGPPSQADDDDAGPVEVVLVEEREANPLFQATDPAFLNDGIERHTLPDGTVVTRDQINEFLTAYTGPLSPHVPQGTVMIDGVPHTPEEVRAKLNSHDEAFRQSQAQREAQARAALSESASRPIGRAGGMPLEIR